MKAMREESTKSGSVYYNYLSDSWNNGLQCVVDPFRHVTNRHDTLSVISINFA